MSKYRVIYISCGHYSAGQLEFCSLIAALSRLLVSADCWFQLIAGLS